MVPSFCANESMGVPVSLTDMTQIKDPLYTPERDYWIDSLLANQFTMSEIEDGTAQNMLVIHKLKWPDCLSHQIWLYIESVGKTKIEIYISFGV